MQQEASRTLERARQKREQELNFSGCRYPSGPRGQAPASSVRDACLEVTIPPRTHRSLCKPLYATLASPGARNWSARDAAFPRLRVLKLRCWGGFEFGVRRSSPHSKLKNDPAQRNFKTCASGWCRSLTGKLEWSEVACYRTGATISLPQGGARCRLDS